jgi:hypothetical protein
LSLLTSYYLCYLEEWGLSGLWTGWLLGLVVNIVCSLWLLKSKMRQLKHSPVLPREVLASPVLERERDGELMIEI